MFIKNKGNKPVEAVRIGIGSFAFRYNIGFGDFIPPKPMTTIDFLQEAHRLGFSLVQLCENLNYATLSYKEIMSIANVAKELGISIEVGLRGLSRENLLHHIKLAELLSSCFIRIVPGELKSSPEKNPDELMKKSINILKNVLPICKEKNIKLGIEDNFILPLDYLIQIVEEIADEHVGLIMDTTNCLGFINQPEEVLDKMKPYLLSVHLKDYKVEKVEGGYLISSVPLGEGWLNVEEFIKKVLSINPTISIIIEYSMRRDYSASVEQILKWEKESVEKNARYIRKLIKGLNL
ncbi:sugar phosphate isomerase/epimerase [Caldicoprobacter guelmensis]|uniref:sugar phosphate isomerase/epimerase family protein n=1 Tax=Caldicoprobacter guelmensis TaxID=1170224 RepID=UPI00195B4D52|nr:sugar phosphate isomerase/epimerase family protein [Caldicoprobacter guelmensis]MBM7583410.1 sugar phosphate isomerase/epimerase [Caldicoprobacter guelmensis]